MKKIILISISCAICTLAQSQSWNISGNAGTNTSTNFIGTTDAKAFKIRTNNSTRITIASGGNVGIGTTSPAYKLHVVGAANGIYGSGTSYGVYGTSPSSYGIYGSSTSGYGVVGASGYIGTYGSGNSYGLYGIGGTYGAYASGTSYGVYGHTSNGYGVAGVSSSSYGLYGSSSSSWGSVAYGTYGAYGSGTTGYGVEGVSSSNYGVYGYSGSNWAVYGDGYIGTYGDGTYTGAWGNGGEYGLVGYGGPYGCWASGASWAGYFSGNVYTTGTYQGSDRALKKNITEFNSATDIINKLKPCQYEYRHDGNYAQMNLPEGSHYGLIAQDVEEVLPNLVKATEFNPPQKTDKDGKPVETTGNVAAPKSESIDFKAVNYTELIPIMIKAMQEQQKEITDLKAENRQMKQDMQNCCLNHTTGSMQDKLQGKPTDQPMLEQNVPNPFSEQTVIRYYLPAGSTAVLKVMNLEGKEMFSTAATKTGYGELTISANTLAAGTYTYTLLVDGKAIESRIMILSE